MPELYQVIKGMGFEPLTKRLKECVVEVDEDGSGALNFEEFVHIMWLYRRTEGFTSEELMELQCMFKKSDKDDSGEISTLELGDIMRYEGYTPGLDQLQELSEEYDVDESGDIGMREFLKLMRAYRETEIKRFREFFDKADDDGSGSIATQELAGVLEKLGHDVNYQMITEAVASVDEDNSGQLNWNEFVDLMEKYRKLDVIQKRKKCGFDEAKLALYREQFKTYDKDGSNDIDSHELFALLADLNLEPRTELEQVQLLTNLDYCKGLAEEQDGRTTFWVFLRLLRLLEDDDDRSSLGVEKSAAEKAGFTKPEVGEFRSIFNHWHQKLMELGEGCGAAESGRALTPEGIARILRSLGITLPSQSDFERLEAICRECDIDGNGDVDFPDFLMVMRKVMDENFRGLNDQLAR
jgi:Ca2+-binding EF-hand superfamily protein